jgi:hypothetical protein
VGLGQRLKKGAGTKRITSAKVVYFYPRRGWRGYCARDRDSLPPCHWPRPSFWDCAEGALSSVRRPPGGELQGPTLARAGAPTEHRC